MKNRTHYFGLSILSVLILAIASMKVQKQQRRFILPLFLAYTGMNYIFEYFILIIGNSYRYYPKLLRNSYFDNVFGSTISQLFVIPTSGVVIALFRLSYKWILCCAAVLLVIEQLFIKRGLFKHHWWKGYYTPVLVQFFYGFAKLWRYLLVDKKTKVVRLITVGLAIFSYYATITSLHVSLLKTCLVNTQLFQNRYRDHFIMATIYCGISAFIFFMLIRLKSRVVTVCTVLTLQGFEQFLIKKNLLIVSNQLLFVIVSLSTKVSSLWVGIYISQLLTNGQSKKNLKVNIEN
ncbi:hypothetical protein [Bacillus suaedae]|uniref:Uncharacterized protein n=1 Tax=Halalkalibacter suaedae TaxID=2822140 RepID=A0A940WSV0_9BACI|nr:hypothetical protein [Bacillus suaedae]MBP3951661.1 hypothetical protein [Bacillus suaedae]